MGPLGTPSSHSPRSPRLPTPKAMLPGTPTFLQKNGLEVNELPCLQTETAAGQRICCMCRDWDWSGAWGKLWLKPKILKRLDRTIPGFSLRAWPYTLLPEVPMTPGRGIVEMCLLNKHNSCARGSLWPTHCKRQAFVHSLLCPEHSSSFLL